MTTATCTNPAHRYLHLAPIPCPDCHGWLDHDGTVMNTETMLARYPFMTAQVQAQPQAAPDYTPAPAARALAGVILAGRLAGTLLVALIVACVLAVVIWLWVHAL